MFGQVLNINLTEIAEPAVNGYIALLNALDFETLQKFAAEMQSGTRGHHSTLVTGIYGLIFLNIQFFGFTFDVFGQRCLSQFEECVLELFVTAVIEEAECAST